MEQSIKNFGDITYMSELTPTPTLEITIELKMVAGDERKNVLLR